MKTTITERAIETIKTSDNKNKVLASLACRFNKTTKTIENWLESKDDMLAHPDSVSIIKAETGLLETEILGKEN